MSEWEIKQANRYYWIVKGMLIPESWTLLEVQGIFNSYIYRIWGNHENVAHEDGFEAAWAERQAKEIEKVAHLGYD